MTKVVLMGLIIESGKKKKKLNTELLGVIQLSWVPSKKKDLFFFNGLSYKVCKRYVFAVISSGLALDNSETWIELVLQQV